MIYGKAYEAEMEAHAAERKAYAEAQEAYAAKHGHLNTYLVTNPRNGHDFGYFDAPNQTEALNRAAQSVGHADYAAYLLPSPTDYASCTTPRLGLHAELVAVAGEIPRVPTAST